MTQHGFTLVELLVVIAVLGVVLAFSLPSFNDFTKSQYLTQAAEQVLGDLRSAQSRSQNGVVDTTTTPSNECWGLDFPSNTGSYSVASVFCDKTCGLVLATGSVRTINFAGVVKSENTGSTKRVVFNKISGLPACNVTLTMTLDSVTKSVVVDVGGNMYVQ